MENKNTKSKNQKCIERLNYNNSNNELDLYLHLRRYEIAMENITGKLILDCGCGMGFGTKLLGSKMPDKKFVGIDIDKSSIDYAKKHNNLKNITFEIMDAQNLNFPNNSFDSVISIENIEHARDYNRYLDEIYKVLKPSGGKLFITTPKANRIENIILKMKGHKTPKNPYHIHEFKINELKNLLEERNFEVIKTGGLYLHVLPTRFKIVKKLITRKIVYNFLVDTSFLPLNDYFYVVAEK